MLNFNFCPKRILVFDIGGTWFRSGYVDELGKLTNVSKTPAVNFKNSPSLKIEEMQGSLVSYLLSETQRLQKITKPFAAKRIAISIGAALNSHTGLVLDSGPLWGSRSKPVDLLGMLEKRMPTMEWTILNDITAALIWHVSQTRKVFKKASLFTVSTGIGSRIYDSQTGKFPVHQELGIQGEVGHLPITFTIGQKVIEQPCDCGGLDHLSAFCSGRGIEALLPLASESFREEFQESSLKDNPPDELSFADLVESTRKGERFAYKFIDAVTLPISKVLLQMFTFDADIDLVFIVGGVVHSLQPYYEESLHRHLDRLGLYLIHDYNRNFFRERIKIEDSDEQAGMRGAALFTCLHECKTVVH